VQQGQQSSFDPQLLARYQRRFPNFDDKMISTRISQINNDFATR
jgi:transposase-like protein